MISYPKKLFERVAQNYLWSYMQSFVLVDISSIVRKEVMGQYLNNVPSGFSLISSNFEFICNNSSKQTLHKTVSKGDSCRMYWIVKITQQSSTFKNQKFGQEYYINAKRRKHKRNLHFNPTALSSPNLRFVCQCHFMCSFYYWSGYSSLVIMAKRLFSRILRQFITIYLTDRYSIVLSL